MSLRGLGLCCLGTLLALTGARANEFPSSAQIAGANYPKMGEHRTIYRLFFKLYDAALFVEPGANADDVLTGSCAFRLEFRYLRNIPKATILESASHMLAKNLSTDALTRIAEPTEQLHAKYRSVQTGDVSSLTYIPGDGTTFTLNGEELITLPGQEFATSYLQIWLGRLPVSIELRDELLGR